MFSFGRTGSRFFAGGIGAVALLIAAGCSPGGGSSPTGVDTDPDFGANNPNLVVAIGDSITFGKHDIGVENCTDDEREVGGFCPHLAQLTGKTVINEGECGEDSNGGAERVRSVLRRWRPGVLLIDYSPNDIRNGTDTLIRNLREMVAAARSNKTIPIIGTMVPAVGDHKGWEPFIENANAAIRALCAELDVECADHFEAYVRDPAYQISPYALLGPDGEHPNPAGYEMMAKTWRWPVLRAY